MVVMAKGFFATARRSIGVCGLVCVGCMSMGQAKQTNQSTGAKVKVAENECWPKGGVGIINTALYVDLKSGKNELVLGGGKRWTGNTSKEKQVVFVWGQSVFAGSDAPEGFKMGEASTVSFEGDKVMFMDFKAGVGGYYQRKVE